MKLSNKNSSKNLLLQTTRILFFSLLAAFGASSATSKIQAQTINDDLQTTTKTTKTTKPTPVKTPPRAQNNKTATTKKTVKKPVVRPVRNAPPVAGENAAAPDKTAAAAPPAIDGSSAAVSSFPSVAPVQTPSEIFERYMNFQQSASVTGKDWESVVRQTNQILQNDAGDRTAKAQLAVAQGELAFNRADYSNALIQFNAAAQLLPDSALPFYGIGRVYLNTKQPIEAEKAFEKSIKVSKVFALAYKGLGDALTAQQKTKKAQDYYRQAARIGVAGNSSPGVSGGNSNNQSAGGSLTGNISAPAAPAETAFDRDLKIARDYTARKKWQMALDKLQPLAGSNPTAELYVAIGDNFFGLQAWLSAQQAYRKAVDLNPNLAIAYYKSGLVLFETNEFQAAAEAFEKSLILDLDGKTINRAQARKMADKAGEKVRDAAKGGKKKIVGFLF